MAIQDIDDRFLSALISKVCSWFRVVGSSQFSESLFALCANGYLPELS